MIIKVLGSGCPTCKKLLSMVEDAVKVLKIDAEVKYVTDMAEIMQTGIMQMPGLMINDKVKVSGRLPKALEIQQIISKEM